MQLVEEMVKLSCAVLNSRAEASWQVVQASFGETKDAEFLVAWGSWQTEHSPFRTGACTTPTENRSLSG
jgi:hypothetical protein